MNKILCAVYDKKSKNYDGFMTFNRTVDALRSFQMSCENNEMFKKWPEDFDFYQIATIKQENEKIEVDKQKVFLAAASHFINKSTKNYNEKTTK